MTEKHRIIEKIKQANKPSLISDSTAARILMGISLVTSNLAAATVGEIGSATFYITTIFSSFAIIFSYHTRYKPWKHNKIFIGVVVLVIFFTFATEIMHNMNAANITSVEPPLASLFIWVQALHSLDTASRRDLLFSLLESMAVLAIASAQGISTSFFIFILIWFFSSAIALETLYTESGSNYNVSVRKRRTSTSEASKGNGRSNFRELRQVAPVSGVKAGSLSNIIHNFKDKFAYILLTLAIAFTVVVLLPPTSTTQEIKLPSSIRNRIGFPNSGSLYQGNNFSEPSKPGTGNSRIRIGGYNGFSNNLNTADRIAVPNTIVMHVRAEAPGYFLSMTYSNWSGTSWSNQEKPPKITALNGGSPFFINSGALSGQPLLAASDTAQDPVNIQTFYIEAPMTNVILGTSQPSTVWFPSSNLYLDTSDSSIRTGVAITPGTVYTVVSADTEMAGNALKNDNYSLKTQPKIIRDELRNYMTLPRPYKRVRRLTLAIIKHKDNIYAKITALEAWMSTHVQYSLNIPPLLPGQDTVNQFLFHGRIGYCEQISTALAVMLRSVGIPTREAVGYVPGNFNPLTDLYDVRQTDAHAWVQVWFPKYGWQNFDPTANVPLLTPNPGIIIMNYVGRAIKTIFWPLGLLFLLATLIITRVVLTVNKRSMHPVSQLIELTLSTGKHLDLLRKPHESPGVYYMRLKEYLSSLDGKQTLTQPISGKKDLSRQKDTIQYLIDTYLYADRSLDQASRYKIKKEIRRLKAIRQKVRYKKYFKKYPKPLQ